MHTTFSTRLAECSAKLGSRIKLAEAAGLSFSQLMRYMNGSSMPTMPRIMALANAAKVNPAWLLTGEENSPKNRSQILLETQTFLQVLQQVEYMLQNSLRPLSPVRKSQFILALCKAAEDAQNREQEFLFSERSLNEMVDFMAAYTDEELGELYTAIENLAYADDPQQTKRWVNLICRGNMHVYDTPSGHRYFDRMLEVEGVYGQEIRKIINKAEALNAEAKHLLDLGCGNGRHLRFVHQHYPHWHLQGVDSADQAVHLCEGLQLRGELPQNTIKKADMRQLPYAENSFDLIIARYSLFCVPLTPNGQGGLDDVFAEITRTLKRGGLFHATTRHGQGLHFYQASQRLDAPAVEQLAHRHGLDIVGLRVFDTNEELHEDPRDKVHPVCKDIILFQMIKPLNWQKRR